MKPKRSLYTLLLLGLPMLSHGKSASTTILDRHRVGDKVDWTWPHADNSIPTEIEECFDGTNSSGWLCNPIGEDGSNLIFRVNIPLNANASQVEAQADKVSNPSDPDFLKFVDYSTIKDQLFPTASTMTAAKTQLDTWFPSPSTVTQESLSFVVSTSLTATVIDVVRKKFSVRGRLRPVPAATPTAALDMEPQVDSPTFVAYNPSGVMYPSFYAQQYYLRDIQGGSKFPMGIAEFSEQNPNADQQQWFLEMFNVEGGSPADITVVCSDGVVISPPTSNPSCVSLTINSEANIDAQAIGGITRAGVPGQDRATLTTYNLIAPEQDFLELINRLTEELGAANSIPTIISVSYNGSELSYNSAQVQLRARAKVLIDGINLTGTTIVVSSGDYGAPWGAPQNPIVSYPTLGAGWDTSAFQTAHPDFYNGIGENNQIYGTLQISGDSSFTTGTCAFPNMEPGSCETLMPLDSQGDYETTCGCVPGLETQFQTLKNGPTPFDYSLGAASSEPGVQPFFYASQTSYPSNFSKPYVTCGLPNEPTTCYYRVLTAAPTNNTPGVTVPGFVSALPNVTVVGATMINNSSSAPAFPSGLTIDDNNKSTVFTTVETYVNAQNPLGGVKSEEAASAESGAVITSGGGFSYDMSRPSWQDSAISNYLAQNPLPAAITSAQKVNRASPDVSVNGHAFVAISNPTPTDPATVSLWDGTSVSAPIFAGILQKVMVSASWACKGLGNVNPALYDMYENSSGGPAFFKDITSGSNKCGKMGSGCYQTGFDAVSGWDPVTGLGTPIAVDMMTYLINHEAQCL